MRSDCYRLMFSLLFGLCVWPSAMAADPAAPLLRNTNYVAILPEVADRPLLRLDAIQFSPRYADLLRYTLIGPDSNTITSGEVPLGSQYSLAAAVEPNKLHVLEVNSGWNACRLDSCETPTALVAWEMVPIHTARGIERLYFYVPAGCKQFDVWVVADTPREGARVRIAGPDGVVFEEEGDYDEPQRLRVPVGSGNDGKSWSLAIVRPKSEGIHLDDVKLWLGDSLPPYLSSRADWAMEFGRRKHP